MNILEAIILGLLQGLSEFIPISSTAHLTIAGNLLGIIDVSHPEQWTAFIATIQLGTLFAVLLFFSKEIKEIPIAFFKENLNTNRLSIKNQSDNSKLGWLIIIGSIPIAVIGLALKDIVEGSLTKDLSVIAFSLIVLALILALSEKVANHKRDLKSINIIDSIIIGLSQCLALIPGASRSGTTITAGLFLGIKREAAAKFSFLLSIPAVLASGLLEFYHSLNFISNTDLINLSVATLVSAVSGYFAIAFLLKYLKTHSTYLFVYYRIILGILIFILLFFKIL